MTILNLLRFLHVLAVVVWLGGLVALNILQLRAGRDHPDAEYPALLRRIDSSELRGLPANPPAAAGRSRLQGRQAVFYGINILVLLSTLWAMELRPTF